MEPTQQHVHSRIQRWGITGAIIAAVTASVCCVAPLLLVALGVSGAWIGSLTVLEPVRPLFTVLALGFLGFAFYRVYRKPRTSEACEPGSYCAHPQSRTLNKTLLWVATVGILTLFAFPYAAPRLFAGAAVAKPAQTAQVVLAVENMYCDTCPITVRQRLLQVPGVVAATVTIEPPEAVVVYDPTRVSLDDLIQATTNVGYPSSVKEREER